jgi:hypothetical protein
VRSHKCWSTSTPSAGVISPPVSSLTREVLYNAQSGIGSVIEQNTTRSKQIFPSHGLRAQVCGRVGASRTIRRSRIHLLGWRPANTFLGSVFDTSTRICYCSVDFLFTRYCSVVFPSRKGREWGSALQPFYTASSGTTTPTSAMSTSVGLNASGYNLFRYLAEVNIIYIFAYFARSNMFMNFASGMLLLSIS